MPPPWLNSKLGTSALPSTGHHFWLCCQDWEKKWICPSIFYIENVLWPTPGPTEWHSEQEGGGSHSEQSKHHEKKEHVSTSPAFLDSLNIWSVFLCILFCIIFASFLMVLLLEYSTIVSILTCRYFWVNS